MFVWFSFLLTVLNSEVFTAALAESQKVEMRSVNREVSGPSFSNDGQPPVGPFGSSDEKIFVDAVDVHRRLSAGCTLIFLFK